MKNKNNQRFKVGLDRIKEKQILILIPAVYVGVMILAMFMLKALFQKMEESYFGNIFEIALYILIVEMLIIGVYGIIQMLGKPIASKKIEGELVDVGFVDNDGQSPLLLSKKKDNKGFIYEFYSPKIPFYKYEDYRAEIETALNIKVVDSSRVIMEFKAKTEECFQPIDGLGATEIEEMVEEYVNAKFSENDFDATVRGVVISGSRCRGLEGKSSDLDVVVEYIGDEREDDMFKLLHEDKLKIGGVPVDINPITKYKTGTLEEYLPGVEKYLEQKSRRISIKDKLEEKKKSTDVRTADAEKIARKKSEEIR